MKKIEIVIKPPYRLKFSYKKGFLIATKFEWNPNLKITGNKEGLIFLAENIVLSMELKPEVTINLKGEFRVSEPGNEADYFSDWIPSFPTLKIINIDFKPSRKRNKAIKWHYFLAETRYPINTKKGYLGFDIKNKEGYIIGDKKGLNFFLKEIIALAYKTEVGDLGHIHFEKDWNDIDTDIGCWVDNIDSLPPKERELFFRVRQ